MYRPRPRPSRISALCVIAALLLVGAELTPLAESAGAGTVSQTFNYSASTQTFTVPSGVTSLTVSLAGGQGGRGGGDSQGSPTPGGYRGVVTGSIAVTPGQVITIGVGGGGGTGVSSSGSAAGGSAGNNPLAGYDGAVGGTAGPDGGSGGGGGSGAATVLQVGGVDLVAAGAGGNGGNGQFLAIVGRRAEDNFLARPDATSTTGRPGMNTSAACTVGSRCDGGASGAGGAGAQGGERGAIQYGGATATEYFGFGGYPGSNSTTGFPNTTASYEYYAGNSANGSVTISYDTGAPGTPGTVNGTAANGAAALSWTAPASTGAAEVTDYVVQYATSAGGPYSTFSDGTSSATSATVTGLTNGTTYWFKVAAVNTYGTSGYSDAMAVGVTPSDVPGAPTITTVTPFDSGLYVDYTPGSAVSPITGYEYRVDSGAWQATTPSANRITVPGLTNGQLYSLQIRALNAIGPSAASTAGTGTPRAVPGAPSSLVVVPGNATASLTWDAPDSDNGSAVTDYVVQYATAVGGPYSTFSDGTSTATSATVTGLTNGTNYFFRVAAVNAAGTGTYSSPTGATPITIPAAPSITTMTPGDGTLAVSFTPGSTGGSPVTGYEYRIGASGTWQSTGSLLTNFVLGSLDNGTAYDVYVRAANAAGTGPASAPSSGTPRTVPAAPAISAVALDTGAVGVSFTTGYDGGSAVTNFEYSVDGGAHWTTRSPAGTASPLTISGLTGGQTYAVVLRAVNAEGHSAPSNESSVTAKGVPDAPVISGITEQDRALTVTFGAPANGGTPITNYEYSLDGGDNWTTRAPASTSTPLVLSGLTNGTAYGVRVRAVNAAGSGAGSNTVSATPRTTPGAPTIDADTIGGIDGALDVVFTPPVTDGGNAISTYEYSTDAGATWRVRGTGSTASPLHITALSSDGTTPLTGGQTYPVEIRAVNAAGPGAASAVATGITTTVPDAPTITSTTPYDAAAAAAFTTPANGGSAIVRFEYRLDGGTWTDTGSLSNAFVITGLTNASSYSLEVRAVNGVGNGPPSAPATMGVLTTAGAPTVGSVTAGDHTLTVAFTPPASDGGTAITTYEYSTDGGVTWRTRATGTTGSPLVISTVSGPGGAPLANGTVYPVQIRAVNAAGSGDATLSTLVAPQGAPEAPTGVALSPGDGRLTVSFTPGGDGGSAITGIEYRLGSGAWVSSGSLSSPFTIDGLTNGTAYDVSVRAVSAIGNGTASTPAAGTPRTVPGSAVAVTATGGDATATVSWAAPTSDGGSAVTGYVATIFDLSAGGSSVGSCATTALTCDVSGLTNGTTYYASVMASNAAGAGTASSPRVAVTPVRPPQVSIASLGTGATTIVVDVTVTDTGGAPITTYEYRLDGGSWTSASTATEPFTISGLTQGQAYSVEIRAVNDGGTGPASAPVSATPSTTPGQPGSLLATRGDASVALTWTAPSNTGGGAIIDYVVQYATSINGTYSTFSDGTSTATSATVTGLTNATAYYFKVAAVNAKGTGTFTSPASATPLGAPSAPTITGITPGSQYLQVAYTAPSSTGGSAITGYQYQLDGGDWVTPASSTSPIQISGLTNGHAYGVKLRAVNIVGGGTASSTTTSTPYGLPAAVTGFVASPGSGNVTLTWDPVNNNGSAITAYNLIRWSAAAEGSISASYSTTATSYTVSSLSDGTYWFTIEATNAAGTGPRSSPRLTAQVGGTVPAAPTLTSTAVTGTATAMQWTNGSAGSSSISGYIVQYIPDSGSQATVASGTTAGTSASFALPSATAPYSLRVAAISTVGVGAFATIRPPMATTGSSSSVGSADATVAGTVNANNATTDTAIEYATSAAALGTGSSSSTTASPSSLTGTTATAISATLTGLSPGTTYYARTKATSGTSVGYGSTVSFTTTAVNDLVASLTAPATITRGADSTWTLRVDNDGPTATGTASTVTATLPAGLAFVSGPAGCAAAAGGFTCTIGSGLASGANTSRAIVVSSVSDLSGDQTVSATVANTNDANATNDSDSATVLAADVLTVSDLEPVVTAPAGITPGVDSTWTVGVTNNGPSDTSSATTLSGTLPTGLAFVSSPDGCTGSGTSFSCTVAAGLSAGATATRHVVASTLDDLSGDTTVSVTSANAEDGTAGNDTASGTVVAADVVASNDLTTSLTAPAGITPGVDAAWTVGVTNAGPSDTTSTSTITATLPVGLAFVSGPAGCAVAVGGFTCTVPAGLVSGGSTNRTVTVSNAPGVSGDQTVSATVANTQDPGNANNGSSATVLAAAVVAVNDITLDGTLAGSVTPGLDSDWVLHVTNDGPSTTAGATTLHVTLPAVTGYLSATGAPCVGTVGGTGVTCTLPGGQAPGATLDVTLDFTTASGFGLGGPPTFTATSANAGDASSELLTQQSDPSSIHQDSDVAVTVSPPPSVTPGTNATWRFDLTNDGPSDSSPTVVVIALAPGLSFASATGASCAEAAGELRCTLDGPVAVGVPATFSVTFSTAPGLTTLPVLTPTVESPDPVDPPVDPVPAPPVTPSTDLEVSASAFPASIPAGGQAAITLTVTNNGPSTATGVHLAVTLPAGLTNASGTGCTPAGATLDCVLADLTRGASTLVVVTSNAAGDAAGPLTATATVTGATPDPNSANNTAAATIDAVPPPPPAAVPPADSPAYVCPDGPVLVTDENRFMAGLAWYICDMDLVGTIWQGNAVLMLLPKGYFTCPNPPERRWYTLGMEFGGFLLQAKCGYRPVAARAWFGWWFAWDPPRR